MNLVAESNNASQMVCPESIKKRENNLLIKLKKLAKFYEYFLESFEKKLKPRNTNGVSHILIPNCCNEHPDYQRTNAYNTKLEKNMIIKKHDANLVL